MNRRFLTILTGALVASCLASTPARAGVNIQIGLPAFFVATSTPVYYEGHATYWYEGNWHYREGRTWRTYRAEPQYLREYRGRRQFERRDYGRQAQRRDYERRR